MAKKKGAASPSTKAAAKGPNDNRPCRKAFKKNPGPNTSTPTRGMTGGGKYGYSWSRIEKMAAQRDGSIQGVVLMLQLRHDGKKIARANRPKTPSYAGPKCKMDNIKVNVVPHFRRASSPARDTVEA